MPPKGKPATSTSKKTTAPPAKSGSKASVGKTVPAKKSTGGGTKLIHFSVIVPVTGC